MISRYRTGAMCRQRDPMEASRNIDIVSLYEMPFRLDPILQPSLVVGKSKTRSISRDRLSLAVRYE